MDRVPLTASIRRQYESNFHEAQGGCYTWSGLHVLPRRPHGPMMPALVEGPFVFDAAKVAYCIEHNKLDYPFTWYRMTCGNFWCVNGTHVRLVERSENGRRVKSLEGTAHFQERADLIRKLLSERPLTTQDEILLALRKEGIGGKATTVGRIVTRIRAELGLPARVPSRRKQTP